MANYKKLGYSTEDATQLLGKIPALVNNTSQCMTFVKSQPTDGNIYGRQGEAWVNLASKLGSNIFVATGDAYNVHHMSYIIAEEYILKNGREPKQGDIVVTAKGLVYTILSGAYPSVYIGNKNAYSVDYRAVDLRPVKGKDYFTDSEKALFKQEIEQSINAGMKTETSFPSNNVPVDNTIYQLGTISSLRIASIPTDNASGILIYFSTPSTGFSLTYPTNSRWFGSKPVASPGKSYVILIADGICGIQEIN